MGSTIKLRCRHWHIQDEKERHLNQLQLADLLNKKGLEVKSGSISKWEKNVNSPNVIQFFALCEILGIDNINDTFGIAIEENLFAQLNEEGKRKTIEYMNLLIKSGMYVREEPVYITNRTLKVFTEPASAGTGLFLDSDQYEEFEVGDDVPATADFGIRVSGDSMEPVYVNKQIVWVHQQDQLENGDIGIFYLNGDAYIKKYQKNKDNVQLISLNKKYAPIQIKPGMELRTFGKVVK